MDYFLNRITINTLASFLRPGDSLFHYDAPSYIVKALEELGYLVRKKKTALMLFFND